MYRDFSDRSKNELLALVSEVEDEKSSNFIDWFGDRWYDFESWIGKLNIKNYLNNVNDYHKKVIDKNNATQSTISNIFEKVNSIDTTFQKTFSDKTTQLSQWLRYVDELCLIINPANEQFDAKYISYTLDQTLKTITENAINKESKTEEELTKDAIKFESKLLKALSKLVKKKDKAKSNDLALTSSAMSYIAGLYTFCTTDYNNTGDIITGGLDLADSSASMWNGVYKYLENGLSAREASRFGKKYQSKVGFVSLVGNLCGFTSDAVDTFKTLIDEDSEGYEKAKVIFKNTTSGADVAQSIVNLKYGQKVLTRNVTAKYQWGVPTANASKLDKASTFISVFKVVASTGMGAANRYGKVSADGSIDTGDFAEIGIAGSVRGLTSVVSGLTFGISDALGLSEQSEEISDNIIEFAETTATDYVKAHDFSSRYVQNAQFLMDYGDNEDNNILLRIGATSIAGAGMIGAITIDGIGDGCSWVGDKISKGWQNFKDLF